MIYGMIRTESDERRQFMGRYQFFKIDTISIFLTENFGDTDIGDISILV